jgi:hypothetical protein
MMQVICESLFRTDANILQSSVLQLLKLLATNTEVPGSIHGNARFTEK